MDFDVSACCCHGVLRRYPRLTHSTTHHGQQPRQARRRHYDPNLASIVCACRAISTQGESLSKTKTRKLKGDQTSRRYYVLSKLRCIWYARFCADVLARNLPPPGPPSSLSLLSATELERRTLRALYLEHAWPRLFANTLVSGKQHDDDGARVDQVVFIPGGTELLVVQHDKIVHWLIVGLPGFAQKLKHIGEWTPFEGVSCRIVKDADVPGVIAVGPREPLG